MDTYIQQRVGRFNTKKKVVLALLVLLVGIVTIAFWLKPRSSQNSIPPLPVMRGALIDSVPVSAIIVPAKEAVMSTVSGGTLVSLLVVPGQLVRKGDALVVLANQSVQQQLAQAQSDLAVAILDEANAEISAKDSNSSNKYDLLKAKNAFKLAELEYNAQKSLLAKGAVSKLMLQRSKAERDAKHDELAYAKERVESASSSGKAKIRASSEKVAILRTQSNSLAEQVKKLTLRAPFDGVVAKIDGKVGSVIGPGVSIADVMTLKKELNLEAAEEYGANLHEKQEIRLSNGMTGIVTSLAPVADGGIIKGHGILYSDARQLRSNAVVPAVIVLKSHGVGNYVNMDDSSIANRSMSGQVRTKSGEVIDRTIKFGKKYGSQIEVLQGAYPGEQIIGLDDEDSSQ